MEFMSKKEFKPEYLEEWPLHFYELSDAALREKCLKEYLKQHPDSAEDQRRLEILQHRYGTSVRKQDKYYYAWCMLKGVSESTSFLNRRRREKDIRQYMIDLGVLTLKMDELQELEWKNFAADFIEKAMKGNSYGVNLLGLGRVSDHDKAFRIANDIHTVAVSLPREIYLEKQAARFREIMEEAFVAQVKEGNDILAKIH